MFEIRKDVDFPKETGAGARGKYPWKEMEPGDSFFIPNREDGTNVRPSPPTIEGKRFTTHAHTEKGVAGTIVCCREPLPKPKADKPKSAPKKAADKPKSAPKKPADKPKTEPADDLGLT